MTTYKWYDLTLTKSQDVSRVDTHLDLDIHNLVTSINR